MEWSKAKNIILIILVVTNIFLCFFVIAPKTQNASQQQKAREHAIALLHDQGISVEESLIPTDINTSQCTLSQDRSRESALASALLGTITPQDLGGSVTLYTGLNGSIRFHNNGEFSAEFNPASMPIGDASHEEYSLDIIKKLEIEAEIYSISIENDSTIVQIGQLWNGIPLQGYGLTLHYHNNALVRITDGTRLAGTIALDNVPTITVPTALMNFLTGIQELGDVSQSIVDIQPAYRVSRSLSHIVELIPIWYIGTDTSAYYLDLVSGELNRSK